jgi:hypothetical protein
MTRFKFLARGAIAPVTGFAWTPGTWVETDGPLAMCERGVHVLRPENLAHWLHEELWRMETDGEEIAGIDCVIARRARLAARVDAWTNGVSDALAAACLDRLARALATTNDAADRAVLEHHHRAVTAHVQRKNPAMAAYVSAMGLSKTHGEGTIIERFRAERVWQSSFLVHALGIES